MEQPANTRLHCSNRDRFTYAPTEVSEIQGCTEVLSTGSARAQTIPVPTV
jgi:hypothetical protein